MTEQEIKRIHLEKLAKPGIKYYTKDKTYIGTIEGRLDLVVGSSFTLTSTGINTSLGYTPLSNTLTTNHIFVGNATNIATDVAMSGDATIVASGAITLATVNTSIGTFNSVTVNAKGLVTSASNVANSLNWILNGNTVGSEKWFGTIDNYDIPFKTNNTERVRILKTGKVGVGTNSPSGDFHIKGSGSTNASYTLKIDNSINSNIINIKNDKTIGIGIDADASTKLILSTTLAFGIYTVGNSIGLYGDTNSGAGQGVRGNATSGYAVYGTATTGRGVFGEATTGIAVAGNATDVTGLCMYAANAIGARAFIAEQNGTMTASNSNVIFDVRRTAVLGAYDLTGSLLQVIDLTASTGDLMSVYKNAGSDPVFFIKSTKNVGIGTSSPSAQLHIKGSGSTSATYSLKIQNSVGTTLTQMADDGTGQFGTGHMIEVGAAYGVKLSTNGGNGLQLLDAYSKLIVPYFYGTGGTGLNFFGDGTGGSTGSPVKISAYGRVASVYVQRNGIYYDNAAAVANEEPVLYIQKDGGNVKIGDFTTPSPSALLEMVSTTQGLLIPRMTATQGSAITGVDGLMIYVTSTNATFTVVGFWGYENGAWVKL